MKIPPLLFEKIKNRSSQKNIHVFLEELHRTTPEVIAAGRNLCAGYMRAEGITRGDFISFFRKDPVYQEAFFLARNTTSLPEMSLANLFFILKYGMNKLSGDIIACGDDGAGVALFMTHVVRCLGLPTRVHTFSMLEENPEEALAAARRSSQKNILLAHIDCHTYAATKYALTAVQPLMHPAGGYLVVDHAVNYSSSLEVFQALEEMVQEEQLHAEQAAPHFVYRIPRISF